MSANILIGVSIKHCKGCNASYLNTEKNFSKDSTRADGLSFYCRKCNRESSRYYEEIKKAPKEVKVCAFSKCDNTFETRIPNKKYCCSSCNTKAYQEKVGKDKINFIQSFNKKLKRSKTKAKNSALRWNVKDVKTLFQMREEGFKYKDMAAKLNRSLDSCMIKYQSAKAKGFILL